MSTEILRAIEENAIPFILRGNDVIGQAQVRQQLFLYQY